MELDNGKWRHSYNLGGTPGGKCSEKLPPIEYEKTIKINEILPDPQDGDFGGGCTPPTDVFRRILSEKFRASYPLCKCKIRKLHIRE